MFRLDFRTKACINNFDTTTNRSFNFNSFDKGEVNVNNVDLSYISFKTTDSCFSSNFLGKLDVNYGFSFIDCSNNDNLLSVSCLYTVEYFKSKDIFNVTFYFSESNVVLKKIEVDNDSLISKSISKKKAERNNFVQSQVEVEVAKRKIEVEDEKKIKEVKQDK